MQHFRSQPKTHEEHCVSSEPAFITCTTPFGPFPRLSSDMLVLLFLIISLFFSIMYSYTILCISDDSLYELCKLTAICIAYKNSLQPAIRNIVSYRWEWYKNYNRRQQLKTPGDSLYYNIEIYFYLSLSL